MLGNRLLTDWQVENEPNNRPSGRLLGPKIGRANAGAVVCEVAFIRIGKGFAVRRLQYNLVSLTGLNREMILLGRPQSGRVFKLTRGCTCMQPAPLARQDRSYTNRNFLSRAGHTSHGHYQLIKPVNDLLTGRDIHATGRHTGDTQGLILRCEQSGRSQQQDPDQSSPFFAAAYIPFRLGKRFSDSARCLLSLLAACFSGILCLNLLGDTEKGKRL